MKLKMYKREGSKKSELSQIRRSGNVPAVLYAAGKPSQTIALDGVELQSAFRCVAPGQLPTTRFTLVTQDAEIPVLIKEVQYYPTTYAVRHVDLLQAEPKQKVRVKVPIEYTGVADCQGIKLGGFLRQVIRYLLVECLVEDIPTSLPLDVRELHIGQSKRLSDLVLPKGLRSLVDLHEVAVVIAKR